MHHPGVLHGAVDVRHGVVRLLDDVRQLKDDPQNRSGREVHRHEADGELPPGNVHDQEGDHDRVGVVEELASDECQDLTVRVLPPLEGPQITLEEIVIVLEEHPEERGHTVCDQGVPVLVPVDRTVLCLGGQAKHRGNLEVLVQAMDVRVGVVNHIVRDLPHVSAGADQLEGEPEEPVFPTARRVGAVKRVVRDVESDARETQSHEDGEPEHGPGGEPVAENQSVRGDGHGEHQERLQDHFSIGAWRDPTRPEIEIDPLLDLGGEEEARAGGERYFGRPGFYASAAGRSPEQAGQGQVRRR